jgi:hypothetical protein
MTICVCNPTGCLHDPMAELINWDRDHIVWCYGLNVCASLVLMFLVIGFKLMTCTSGPGDGVPRETIKGQ